MAAGSKAVGSKAFHSKAVVGKALDMGRSKDRSKDRSSSQLKPKQLQQEQPLKLISSTYRSPKV